MLIHEGENKINEEGSYTDFPICGTSINRRSEKGRMVIWCRLIYDFDKMPQLR